MSNELSASPIISSDDDVVRSALNSVDEAVASVGPQFRTQVEQMSARMVAHANANPVYAGALLRAAMLFSISPNQDQSWLKKDSATDSATSATSSDSASTSG